MYADSTLCRLPVARGFEKRKRRTEIGHFQKAANELKRPQLSPPRTPAAFAHAALRTEPHAQPRGSALSGAARIRGGGGAVRRAPPRPEAAEGRPVTAPRRRRAMRHCVRAPQRRRERPELCGGGAGRPAGSQTARIPSGCDTPLVRGKGSPSLQPTFFWGGGGGRSGRFPSQHPYETNGRSLKFFCPTPPNLPHSPGSLCFSGVAPVIA